MEKDEKQLASDTPQSEQKEQQSLQVGSGENRPTRNMLRRIMTIALWVTVSPILLVILLILLLYIPAVQQFAVDTTTSALTEQIGMKVNIEEVRLKFPLDLSLKNITAVRELSDTSMIDNSIIMRNDTILDAEELVVSVRLRPLFNQNIEVDAIRLNNVKINTYDLIEACSVNGVLGEFVFESHTTSLLRSEAVVSKALLADAYLTVVLSDSVAEDTTATTASPPLPWTIKIEDVRLQNIGLQVKLPPLTDSVCVNTHLGKASVKGLIDLEQERYNIYSLRIDNTSLSYDIGAEEPMQGLDANHISLNDIGISVDSLTYAGRTSELALMLNRLEAKERSGLDIIETHTKVAMDSVSLYVEELLMRTKHSHLTASVIMDMDAFSSDNPGHIVADATVCLGWKEMECLPLETMGLNDTVTSVLTSLPPVDISMSTNGTMERLSMSHMTVTMPEAFSITSKATATNLLDSINISADMKMQADIWNVDFIKKLLPAEMVTSFIIPKNTSLTATAKLEKQEASVNANLNVADAIMLLSANYGLTNDNYHVAMDISNLVLNKVIPLEDQLDIAGSLSATGQGFDIYSPSMWAEAAVRLDTAHMGKIDLSNVNTYLKFKGGDFGLKMTCNNEKLQTALGMKGSVNKDKVYASLDLDLPFADFKAMGMSETRLEVSTKGSLSATYNMADLFRVKSELSDINMTLTKDTIKSQTLSLYAEAMPDSTAATLKTGDIDFDFRSPNNLFCLFEQGTSVGNLIMSQIDARKLELDTLKNLMPVMSLYANAGQQNVVSKMLSIKGMSFSELAANIQTSPSEGVSGHAHIYGYRTDSVRIDTAFINIAQDSNKFVFTAGVESENHKNAPGFQALLDGYAGQSTADAHLTFLNHKGKTGIDLGVNATMMDSLTHITLYPAEPILAFSRFTINKDNFIDLHNSGSIAANIKLQSLKDNSSIELTARPEGERIQDARAVITNLNLGELLTVMPFMPKMDGMLGVNANYVQTADNFSVDGKFTVDRFSYEGALVGNLKSEFAYTPVGEMGHDVDATFYHNGKEVADINGEYDATDAGRLDAILNFKGFPLSMASPFVPDHIVAFDGELGGGLKVEGAMDKLQVNGSLQPDSVRMTSEMYGLDIKFGDAPIVIENSCLTFDKYPLYAAGKNYLTLNGDVDFSDLSEMMLNLSLYGKDFQLIDAERTRKSIIFGKMYGDFFARVNGTTNDLSVRGMISVLNKTDMTYVMADTPLSIDYRLEDIVTFVDFSAPPDTTKQREERTFMGMEMRIQLMIEDGAKFRAEFSADRQSYVNVQGGGSLVMNLTPEGVLSLQGRYTVNEGEMKYTLPVIPLKTFTLQNGSYIDFTGDPMNPILHITATERTKASVSSADGNTRSVAFDVGLKITNTLSNMGLEFTINAPEDLNIQNELAGMSTEEKNKLAVAMLATGMYLSSSNSKGFSASNALNNFLQNEINNIAGQALNTAVDVNVGMEQNTRDDGSTRTDYSFKFSKRLFSDRLNIVIGGKISADGNETENESGAYIDDVSLEWRLDDGGTRYIRVFHEKNYDNLIEGELIENGAGVVLRKKVDNLSELFIFKKNK